MVWCEQGSDGGGSVHLSVHEGEGAGAKKVQKPSFPAQFWVCCVKRWCRAMGEDTGALGK